MTEDLNDLLCPHSAAGRPERFPAEACILAGECGCAYGAEWTRALRLADDAQWLMDRVAGWSIEAGEGWACVAGLRVRVAPKSAETRGEQ